MAGIGYITTSSFKSGKQSITLPMDEGVCGLLFDISDFYEPFGNHPLIRRFWDNDQVHLINNLTEADMYGLCNDSFMGGVAYYHLRQFYNYIGTNTPLYVCFTTDSSMWSAVDAMQTEACGRIFQIGVWTSQFIWNVTANGLVFTDLLSNLQSAAEKLSGKLGESSLGSTPLSIIVSPNTTLKDTTHTLNDIPDASQLGFNKVSVCLAQNGTDEVVSMQSKCPYKSAVGCVGLIMACLHLAYAEESIAYVDKFDLNKNDDFDNAEVYFGGNHFSVNDIVYAVGDRIASKGYILPCTYKGKEAGVFFSGDPTLSNGDYKHISSNRIMNKCRRAVHSAILPYINGHHIIDTVTGDISESSKAIITTDILSMLDSVMVNPLGQSQINGRSASISKGSEILDTDAISLGITIVLAGHNNVINEMDDFEL